jgi:hypothetical protein
MLNMRSLTRAEASRPAGAAIDLRTQCGHGQFWEVSWSEKNRAKSLFSLGERGGTRTLDPMIKSHVLYHLSYALTRRAV